MPFWQRFMGKSCPLEDVLKLSLIIGLVIFTLVGCGQAPDGNAEGNLEGNSEGNQAATAPAEIEINPDGFFTDVTQFHEENKTIRTIGVNPGRNAQALDRINKRYELIIEPHKENLKGAKILDFGSYDGRWTYAAIDAGAERVTGIEINSDFTDAAEANMKSLGVSPDKYDYVVGDLLTVLKGIEPGEYDGVICAGIYYHITYHVELMKELKRLDLDWVIMDTTVVTSEKPIVQWSVAPYGLEGTPSQSAVELIAEQEGFEYKYVPSNHFGTNSMWDYNTNNRITMLLY
jgi:hypothetical protein